VGRRSGSGDCVGGNEAGTRGALLGLGPCLLKNVDMVRTRSRRRWVVSDVCGGGSRCLGRESEKNKVTKMTGTVSGNGRAWEE
jgi:hypothetical protein